MWKKLTVSFTWVNLSVRPPKSTDLVLGGGNKSVDVKNESAY